MARRRTSVFSMMEEALGGTSGGASALKDLLGSLTPRLSERLSEARRLLREEMERAAKEAGGPSEGQAEALVEMLYAQVSNFEERGSRRGVIRRTGTRLLRAAVVEVELALLPHRAGAFRLLGARRSEDFESIKKKYRALAREHHPDRPGGDHKKMQELNEAYRIVSRMKGA
ncbi:MAG: J domain-containing protein [Bdellovibrionota bacterium]